MTQQVRARWQASGGHGDPRLGRPQPARFPSLGLIVKFGSYVSVTEGQCLFILQHEKGLRVPEVYGWTTKDGIVYLYMELIRGVTLEERWPSLSRTSKEAVARQLNRMITHLRSIEADPSDMYVGCIGRKPLQEILFVSYPTIPGPFPSVADFHDFYSRPAKLPPEITIPERAQLPDDSPIRFTHGDLHPSNIIVSAAPWWWGWWRLAAWRECLADWRAWSWDWRAWARGEWEWSRDTQVLAIVDWHQSGWLPSYWEYCKALWTSSPGDWQAEFLPMVIEPSDVYDAWERFALLVGM